MYLYFIIYFYVYTIILILPECHNEAKEKAQTKVTLGLVWVCYIIIDMIISQDPY